MKKDVRIVITGAAGLLGQNTILLLKEKGYYNIMAIDKHHENIEILRKLNPELEIIEADLSENKEQWQKGFEGADILLQMHAQITSLYPDEFIRNSITSTEHVLETAKEYRVSYIVHISSSVVISVADDDYTRTKKAQENLIVESGISHCVLRPPLMFGWFDKKHLGWLSRFMEKTPVFPIPGDGKFLRQPLYARDMARVVIAAMEQQLDNKIYNIIGREEINYIDIIKAIKRIKKLHTIILTIPYGLFKFLMDTYAVVFKNPPFTSEQLKALTAGDYFPVENWWDVFGVTPTPFEKALRETFEHNEYSDIVLKP